MTSKGLSFSLSTVMSGISMAAPLMVHRDAESSIQSSLNFTPAHMAVESSALHRWVDMPQGEVEETATVTFNLGEAEKVWTGKLERQFLSLARKDALGQITPEELEKLDKMGKERDALKDKLSIKEIMFRRKQMEMESRLLQAAKDYFCASGSHVRSSY